MERKGSSQDLRLGCLGLRVEGISLQTVFVVHVTESNLLLPNPAASWQPWLPYTLMMIVSLIWLVVLATHKVISALRSHLRKFITSS